MSQQAQEAVQAQQKIAEASSTKGSILQRAAVIPAITPVHSGMLQRCSGGVECAECREKRLENEGMMQRAAVSASPRNENGVPPIVHEVLSSPGQSLDAGTRAFMEPHFGHDFSQVRVHTDARAAESARAVNALAYTVGRDVVFGTGQFMPETMTGKRLLAHELTHVVQQGTNYSHHVQHKLDIGSPNDSSEHEAEQNAYLVATSEPLTSTAQPAVLARAQDTTAVTVTAPTGPNVCNVDQHQKIFPAVTQAQSWLDQTFTKLGSYIADPKAKANKGVGDALNRHFRSADVAVAQHVLRRVSSIKNKINSQNLVTECHDNKDTICPKAGAYVLGNLLVFCPSFFEGSDNLWHAKMIVHEMAHALTEGQSIVDRGYIRDRVYVLLSRDEALTNADSYGFFVRQVGSGDMPNIEVPKDTQEDCDAKGFPGWSEQIKNAIARAQRWNRDAQVWASDRKPEFVQATAPLRKQYLDDDALATLDVASKAYDKLESELTESLDFECEPEGGGRCEKFTTYWYIVGDFHICPDWTKLKVDERIVAMLAGLYGYKGDVDNNKHRWQYAKLAQAVTQKQPQPVISGSSGPSPSNQETK
jgi:hypothetical protein